VILWEWNLGQRSAEMVLVQPGFMSERESYCVDSYVIGFE